MRSTNLSRLLADKSGFTLIELLGVAVILIILAVMALPVFAEVSDRAREGKAQEQLRIIEQQIEAYYADPLLGNGHYPLSLKDLFDSHLLKQPASIETPWSSSRRPIYYYYGIDSAAKAFVLGDAGPDAVCTVQDFPCGNANGDAFVVTDLASKGPDYFSPFHGLYRSSK